MIITNKKIMEAGGNMTPAAMSKYRLDCDAELPMCCIKDGEQFCLHTDGTKKIIEPDDLRYSRYKKIRSFLWVTS